MSTFLRPQSSGGNATVPGTVPILPVQAFVDATAAWITAILQDSDGPIGEPGYINTINWSGMGITSLGAGAVNLLWNLTTTVNFPAYDLSGNALNTASVDAVLAALAGSPSVASNPGILDLSGGTNAVPTDGVLNADYVTLLANVWTVTINT